MLRGGNRVNIVVCVLMCTTFLFGPLNLLPCSLISCTRRKCCSYTGYVRLAIPISVIGDVVKRYCLISARLWVTDGK